MSTRMHHTAPSRSTEQRYEALARANAVRSARARFKAQMKRVDREEARRLAQETLAAPDHAFETMKVHNFLMTMPKVGRVKALAILRVADASPSKTLGGLSGRQRDAIAAELMRRRIPACQHGG